MHVFKFLIIFLVILFLTACNDARKKDDIIHPLPVEVKDTEIFSGKLAGLYRNAGVGTPVILIIPGSGPTDKNGNSGSRLQSNSYKFLAQQLADHGISTVRVDKRGMFSSVNAGDGNAVSVDIYAQDYRSWMETIIKETEQSCVYLLGHSEGGVMATAAAQGENNVCGLILVATPGQKLGDVLRTQLRNNPANAPILQTAEESLALLEIGQSVDVSNMHPALQRLFRPDVQGYLMSVLPTDPAKLLSDISVPTLILQGDNDFQVSVEDANRLKDNAQNGVLVIFKDVNHVLKVAPRDRSGNFSIYNSPETPIDNNIIEAIQSFVHQHK